MVDNGLQDYNYIFSNCMEVTAELSCSKKPPPEKLSAEWDNNLDSMLAFLGSVHGGVMGLVTDEQGNVIERANVSLTDFFYNFNIPSALSLSLITFRLRSLGEIRM